MRARVWWSRNTIGARGGPSRGRDPTPARTLREPDRVAFVALIAVLALIALTFGCVPDAPEGGVPTHPGDRFSVTLVWDAPTTDAVGQPLEDLAGYRLYYRSANDPTAPEIVVETDSATRYTVDDLPAGSFVFAVTAVDVDRNESERSESIDVGVGGG